MGGARNLRACVVAGMVAALLAGAPAYADEASQPAEVEDVVAIADAEGGPADAEADPAPEGVEAQGAPDEDEAPAGTDEPAGETEPAAEEEPAADPDQLGAAADPDQLGAAALLRGTMGGVTWTAYADHSLVFAPTNGKSGTLAWNPDKRSNEYELLWRSNIEDYEYPLQYDPKLNIRTVRFAKGIKAAQSLQGLFSGFLYLETADLRGLDFSGTTSVEELFLDCSSLKSVNLSGVDLSRVTNASSMFMGCTSLVSVDLSGANFSGLKDATSMFDECRSLKSIDLSALRGATLTNMKYLFWNCCSLKSVDLSGISVDSERRDDYVFTSTNDVLAGCPNLESFTIPASWPMEVGVVFWAGDGIGLCTPLTIPDPTSANGKWWSVKAKKWFTVQEIRTQRSGIADTYKNDDGSGQYASVPVYRMYNFRTSEHLYTTSTGEYTACGKGAYNDWLREGVAWRAPKKSGTPVWRLYNRKSGDHHYTTSRGEKDSLLATGDWRYEGTAFYSLAKGDADAIPLYRVYNRRLRRGQHHYTASVAERDALVAKHGWRDEHVGFYGYKSLSFSLIGVIDE